MSKSEEPEYIDNPDKDYKLTIASSIQDNDGDETVLVTAEAIKKQSENWMYEAMQSFDKGGQQYSVRFNEASSSSTSSETTLDDIKELALNAQSDISKIQKINQLVRQAENEDDIIGKVHESIESNLNANVRYSFDNLPKEYDQDIKDKADGIIKRFHKEVNINDVMTTSITSTYDEGRNPAVPGAGVIEYAEMDDLEEQLSSALLADISNIDIANYEDIEEKEDMNLADKTKKDVSVEDTEKEKKTHDSVDETEKDKKKKDEETAEKKKKTSCAEDASETKETAESEDDTEKPETASLTDCDLYRKISKACEDKMRCWGYISYWFPEEHVVWFHVDNAPTQLDYILFTYTVENDEVTVSEPQDVKLTVSVSDVNTVLAEKDVSGSASYATSSDTANLVDVIGMSGSRYKIKIANAYTGYIDKNKITTPDKLTTKYPHGVCTGNDVAVHKGAGKSYHKISGYPTLNKDNEVDILGSKKDSSGNVWKKVRIAGKHIGYVFGKYIKQD